jgi:hypothetical protein
MPPPPVISVPADHSLPADDRRRLRVVPGLPVDAVRGGDDTVSNGAGASTGPISSDRR